LISRAFRWQRTNVIHEVKEEELPYFFCRLNPPRPSFALDMTDEERALMEEHGAYWTGHMENGKVVVFGVVGDPAGPWGASIVEVADEGTAQALTVEDPVIVRGDGFSYDIFSMPNAVAPSARRGSTDL
jgi:uncharacterized protein